jgi:hypothetical protein
MLSQRGNTVNNTTMFFPNIDPLSDFLRKTAQILIVPREQDIRKACSIALSHKDRMLCVLIS